MAGFGTEVAKQIPQWAVSQNKGCKCKSMQAKWDKYGRAWAIKNRESIIGYLVTQKRFLMWPLNHVPNKVARKKATEIYENAIRRTT